jgi:hypothetical protein
MGMRTQVDVKTYERFFNRQVNWLKRVMGSNFIVCGRDLLNVMLLAVKISLAGLHVVRNLRPSLW